MILHPPCGASSPQVGSESGVNVKVLTLSLLKVAAPLQSLCGEPATLSDCARLHIVGDVLDLESAEPTVRESQSVSRRTAFVATPVPRACGSSQ